MRSQPSHHPAVPVKPRLARFLATCPTDDPLAVANRLVDEALVAQDEGRFSDSDALLAQADRLVAEEV